MTIVVPRATFTNISDNVYLAQFLWTDTTTTNRVRSVARGTVRVNESLYDDD